MICASLTVTLLSFGAFVISASPVPQTVEIQNHENSLNVATVFDLKRLKKEETRESLCAPSVKSISVKELERALIEVDPSKSKAEIDGINKNLIEAAKMYRQILLEKDLFFRIAKCDFTDEIGPTGQKQICVQKYTEMSVKGHVFEYPSHCKTD